MHIRTGVVAANGTTTFPAKSQVFKYFDEAGVPLDAIPVSGGGGGSGGGGDASAANQLALNTLTGGVTETVPANDTASAGLNGRLQRVAVNLTAINGLVGAITTAAPASDTASSNLNGRMQRVAQNITAGNTKLDALATALALTAPISNAAAVTPSDTVDLTNPTRSIWVGTPGDVRVNMVGGQTVTFPGLTIGWHNIRATRVYAANTTASGIVAGW